MTYDQQTNQISKKERKKKMSEMKWNNYGNYVYQVPEGLRELCNDISREVLRSQPKNIYCFIADYVDARLARQKNTKVAHLIVDNIIHDAESIVNTLDRLGFDLKQIGLIAPKLQNSFREYLDNISTDLSCNKIDIDQKMLDTMETSLKNVENNMTEIQNSPKNNNLKIQSCVKNVQRQLTTVNKIQTPCKVNVSSLGDRRTYKSVNSEYLSRISNMKKSR